LRIGHERTRVQFRYPCPGCRTTNNLHDPDCRFAGRPHHDVEKAYVDVLAVLTDDENAMPEDTLRAIVDDRYGWSALHAAALDRLRRDERVDETDRGLVVPPPEERRDRLREPDQDPLATIYHRGSVPGCHDNAVFAMIAYYEMVGFTWSETRELVVEWLRESGAWARGGFEEASPEELVDSKRHVYEAGYGWKEKAKAAKSVIDRST
jgi:hypothetical protein